MNAHNNGGVAALHLASCEGHAEALRELLKRPDAAVNAQENLGHTPLKWACVKGHLMAATILIAAGADLALLDNYGNSALRLAEWPEMDDEEPSERDNTPTAAQREEHKALVRLLKERGAA